MIESLFIRNLILIEKAEIHFGSGLNIITGETGAGKSAILSGIRLTLGERADVDLIRKGSDLAVVEAKVDGLLIRREVHRFKPSRCFIDDELVSLQELREKMSSLELIDQSAAQKLFEHQIEYLDAFGKIESFLPQFQILQCAERRVFDLLEGKRTASLDKLTEDLTYIEEVNWQEGEEEKLSAEHHLLTHAQELLEKISQITAHLAELSPIKRLTNSLEPFPNLKECVDWLKNGALHFDEANRFLLSYADRLELDPNRLFAVEKRLADLEHLRRKFGSYSEVEALRTSLKTKIEKYSTLDLDLQTAESDLERVRRDTHLKAAVLTELRTAAAFSFSEAVVSELKSLNLPDVRFRIEINPKPLSSNGADAIQFLFAANPGSELLPLNQCASGGELSRLLFAIKTVLAGKERNSCLIFDEIDSNIGGKTAQIFGAKLQAMAAFRQLIAVTHFVQVARFAGEHFLVEKKIGEGSAETVVHKLTTETKVSEYARMMGG